LPNIRTKCGGWHGTSARERESAKAAAAIDRIVDRLADGTLAPPIAKAKVR
jgi:hypothetical protein